MEFEAGEFGMVLENLPEDKHNYHGNSYVGACVCESKFMAAEFLKRLSKTHPGRQAQHLQKAADYCEKSLELMKEFTEIFPFKHHGEMPPEARKKGAEILRRAKPIEEETIKHMRKALKHWETP